MQSSDGNLDGNGLAPVRFLDRRARRSAQAANFRRDVGTVTFSGLAPSGRFSAAARIGSAG